jgi:PPK2 family polyphosphate:nucleotide phosphotransferase
MGMDIRQISTRAPEGLQKQVIKDKTKQLADEMRELATMMYANKTKSLLVVLQGMDSSGKDGVSKAVFSKVSPTIVSAYSFKKPSEEEFAHDFLWRVHKQAPRKGEIKLFVRSHYEDILIQRVHNWIDEKRVRVRMDAINAFEKLLQEDNDTIVMKFFLHLSKERQKEKLLERIEEQNKNYKHNDNDWQERKHWDKYMSAYQDAIDRSDIPWHIVPSDQPWYRNYFVAEKVVECLRSLDMHFPPLEEEPKIDLNV